jgi:hypothetical protein
MGAQLAVAFGRGEGAVSSIVLNGKKKFCEFM